MNSKFLTAYDFYFGFKVGNHGKKWAPQYSCTNCYMCLTKWLDGKRPTGMPFAIPMIWKEPRDHTTDCYFCSTKIEGHSLKTKDKITYPICDSAKLPVSHSDSLPIPTPPSVFNLLPSPETSDESNKENDDDDFMPETESAPHFINQQELSDLIRDLHLSKSKAEVLGSRLQEWHLLTPDTRVTIYRNRHERYSKYFIKQNSITFCTNVEGLLTELGCAYSSNQWRLFIDSSKYSLKAVLIHIGNKHPSIPIAHAVGLQETYETMKTVLDCVSYGNHKWIICSDLKVVALLLGLQLGFTKYMCFLCLWDSRDTKNHYVKKIWPKRTEFSPGYHNVKHIPLVEPLKIVLPPLHIKLSLVKCFVKAMNKNGAGFKYVQTKFSRIISEAKIKEGVFDGPQIRELLKDRKFEETLIPAERNAWQSFKAVVHNFLGNNRADDFKNLVESLVKHYQELGCRMSLKLHFLDSHLDFFPENLGAVSDEHGERFHQEIRTMEKRYQGKWNEAMMADYCWFLKRDTQETHKRQSKLTHHF